MEAALDRDLGQREFPTLDEAHRALDTLTEDELMRGDAESSAKEPSEVKWTDASVSSENEKRYFLAEVRQDEIDDPSKLERIELGAGSRHSRLGDGVVREQVEGEPNRQGIRVQKAV